MAPVSFKYQLINEEGQPSFWLSKKGSFDGETIQLVSESIPATAILHLVLAEKILALVVPNKEGATRTITALIHSGNASKLKKEIDRVRSAAQVALAEKSLQSLGQSSGFRKEICPNCEATLNLTHFDRTPQLFCDYCDTIYTVPKQPDTPSMESQYRLCEHCGMYSRPAKFTEFYFYFLFVFYGFWTKESMRCPACMRGTAWKMLAMNFLFVLGIVPSVYQLIRAYASDSVGGVFSGLHAANLRATKRDYSGATKIYQSILNQVPYAAGVHYNLGLALVQNQEWGRAASAFELSLDDCSNYRYAAGGLMECYGMLGRSEQLAEMHRQWDSEEMPA